MITRRCSKRPKRYIKGVVLPYVSVVCLVLILACFIMPVISGQNNVSGIQSIVGVFDFPQNPLNIIGNQGVYYQEFIKDAFLSITSPYFNDLYRYFATLILPLVLLAIIILAIVSIVKAIKEILDKRTRAGLRVNYFPLFVLSVIACLLIPGLNIGDYTNIGELFINFALFLHTYTIGIGLIIIAVASFILTLLPLITRLVRAIVKGRGAILE